ALLLLTGPFLLPEFKDDSAGRLDLVSVLLSMAAILPLVYGVKQAAKHGLTGPTAVALLAGIAFGVLFARRQLRASDPLLDLSLFRNRSFTVALGVMLAGAFAIGGAYLFITQFLQMVAGLSPFQAGLRLLPAAALLIVASTVAPALARRFGPGTVVGAAMFLSAIGYAVLAFADTDGTGIVMIGFAIVYTGIGPMMALSVDLVVGAASPEKAGAASAMQETMSEFGLALGIAVVGSVGMALYRDEFTGNMPEGVPAEAGAAGLDALSGALDAAAGLPAVVGGEFLAVARDAFSSGLNAAAVIGAVLSAAVGILAATLLRRVGRDSG
ncbi:MAG TPA: MFS transporter, partial [Phytomonospora sp.]